MRLHAFELYIVRQKVSKPLALCHQKCTHIYTSCFHSLLHANCAILPRNDQVPKYVLSIKERKENKKKALVLPGEAKAYCINFRITRAVLGRCKKVNLWTPGISLIGLILTLVKDRQTT